MKTLLEEWQIYVNRVYPGGLSFAHRRRLFMGYVSGALVAFNKVFDEAPKLPEDQAFAALSDVINEAQGECNGILAALQSDDQAKPVRLNWEYRQEHLEYVARVAVKDHLGSGHYVIHAICRPGYCDRGKFHVLIEPVGVAGPDDQEGFPRYYFRLENMMDEMEAWVNEREAVKEALKHG